MKKLSIADIAAQLNVSKTVVSFILNNRAAEQRISDELVQRVQSFIKEVGYKPNPIAKSLRTGKTNIIALMVENIADPFFASVARLIENSAYKSGYKIIYCSTDNDTEKTKELLTMFRERSVDGYVIAPPEGIQEEIQSLVDEGTPVVFFDRHLPNVHTDVIEIDNQESTYKATNHLISKGYKNIAFITFSSKLTQMKSRLAGYKQAINAAGLNTYIKQIVFDQNEDNIVNPIIDFLKSNQNLDAVLFGALQAGTNGLKAIRHLEYKIPDDIAVISFDDCDVFNLYSPSITAISQPIDKIADSTINLLLKRLNASTQKQQKIVIKTNTVFRKSVK
ncbi:LacI family transcriptional regulator [Arachidicoccus ginsenosidimutans]|uniref:LacI family DNA-binding transcriptional regulator n=1 Tax=Arachidicoccus sp. BS20 TaxID=1850526 RepID=UPI0007F12FB0|nr:substrate-binding domain-containing protein [Arachidicoccus sp. BS20]ANI89635.1 LacI family transcriptional regulator [Arachidicoccus sp. BS20]